jgi:hypothetical protein
MQEELQKYQLELQRSKKKSDTKLLRATLAIQEPIMKTFLYLYLDRCRFINAFAFIQYRRMLPKPAIGALSEIFES